MTQDIRALLPKHKFDIENTEALIARGYPDVEPILDELIEWLMNANWPIARPISEFLASLGAPIVPHVRRVLGTDDEVWKYFVLKDVVSRNQSVAEALRPELERLSKTPTPEEKSAWVDQAAQDILKQIAKD